MNGNLFLFVKCKGKKRERLIELSLKCCELFKEMVLTEENCKTNLKRDNKEIHKQ